MRRSAVVFALVLSASVVPALASAQSAAALIEQGIALREDGRDEEALATFTRAYEDGHSAQALAQMALAEQALGRHVLAESHLTAALDDHEDRFIRRNRAALAQALTEITAQIGTLSVEGGVPGAIVDAGEGTPEAMPLEVPLRLAAGRHHVVVRAEGYRTFEADIEITARNTTTITATLVAEVTSVPPPEPEVTPVPTTPAPASASSDAGWMLPVGIAAASVGVVAVGIASGLMVVREDNARARLTCTDSDPACRSRYQAALDAEGAGVGLYVAGGLLLAAGGALVLVDLLGQGEHHEASAFTCAPGLLSLACSGSF